MDDLLGSIKNSDTGNKELSLALKNFRQFLELSLESVAENTFISPQNIRNIEENMSWNKPEATYLCLYYHSQVMEILYLCLKKLNEKMEAD